MRKCGYEKGKNDAEVLIRESQREILELQSHGITPEEIEEIVSSTTISDIENMLSELSNDDKRREAFEGEIGYDG
ncbi:MAG: hypothetical protein IJN50_03975 [Clostridia bacterium]|nr:hypothetical protein [Clostridia bacterium]